MKSFWQRHPMSIENLGDFVLIMEEIILDKVRENENPLDYNYLDDENNYHSDVWHELFNLYLDKYKYYIIDVYYKNNQYKLSDDFFRNEYNKEEFKVYSFVVPFLFLEYKIKVKKSYINKLISLLRDGGTKYRINNGEFRVTKNNSYTPQRVCDLIKKNKNYLFLENYKGKDINELEFLEIIGRAPVSAILEDKGSSLDGEYDFEDDVCEKCDRDECCAKCDSLDFCENVCNLLK